ncbi:hypothetical protein [Halorubrum sp. DTA98]|uniref:hypothetical protein n=1 Tax=Halorubrum sp. DTA98 TaxID=3402163 RepID=UPI003AB0B2E2
MKTATGSLYRVRTGRELPQWARATFAVGLALVAFCVVTIAANPTAPGYEISFFQAYPLRFWAGLVTALALGQLLILRNAFDPEAEYWKLGVVLAGIVNIVLLTHPHVRYTLYGRGDVLTHIGYVRHVIATGTIMETNWYPVIHFQAAMVAELTGMAPKDAISLFPIVFSVIYLASFVYLLARLSPSPASFLFALSVGVLLLFGTAHIYAAPSAAAFFLVPLVVYLFFRLHDAERFRTYAAIFVLVTLTLIPFHPLTFLYLLSILLSLRVVYSGATRVGSLSLDVPGPVRSPTLLLATVLFLWWYSSFSSVARTGFNILATLLGRSEGGQFDHLAGVAAAYSPDIVDVLTIGIVRFGLLGFLCGGATFLTGWYLLGSLRDGDPIDSRVVAFTAIFVTFTTVAAAAFFVDLVFRYHRFARPVYLTAPILIGVGLAFVDQRIDRPALRRFAFAIVVICLLSLAVLSVFGLHLSPITTDSNAQVTSMEIEGSDWFYEHRDRELLTDEIGFKQFRFYSVIAEEITRDEAYNIVVLTGERNIRQSGTAPPDHFGYDENDSAAAAYDDDRYLILTELGREEFPELYPEYEPFWRFTPEDFQRLERDPAIDHVYDNGEFDVYYVHGS